MIEFPETVVESNPKPSPEETNDSDRLDINRTHAVLDRANVPRTGLDKQLTLDQRATILVHWYQKGDRR